MYEMGYTLEQIRSMTLEELNFIVEGLKWIKKEEAEQAKKAGAKVKARARRR